MSLLQATAIEVSYGARPTLDGVDFSAKAGELTAIVGPNGSGKTTLLRAMTGELAYEGRVRMNGEDCAEISVQELAMRRAVLPQASRLAFPFTVLEVVRLGLTAGMGSDRLDDREYLPQEALCRVGLSGFEGRMFQELSGGEKQRVQLARVLVQIWQPVWQGEPRWLLLDEPVSALDIGHQMVVMQIAKDYAAAGGGVVAVMHDLNLTAMFADSVALLDRGRLVKQGTPREVFTTDILRETYACPVQMNTAPAGDVPWLLPQSVVMPAQAAAE